MCTPVSQLGPAIFDPICLGLGYTRWRTSTASGATTASAGTISRHRTRRRNTRKVSIQDLHANRDPQRSPGKYMLEREKLVKENAWQVSES